ncbi:MAG TPA: nicotinate phosphoribosyltransferase [Crocinitomix sp.]|nr:nicotinate phosphoribosyltransferase [Bacteroidia bacterium]HIP35338.1 nicotinate phosphoribosyltransferase [Crocinitomix sp.]
MNPLLYTDGYKVDHRRQYPNETTLVYSNWTPRKSRIEGIDKVVFFGLQYFIKRYLIQEFQENFFDKPKAEICKKYSRRINNYLGENKVGIEHIEELHDLGYIPMVIKALPEGVSVPIKVPMFTMYNTLPQFFWLTNYFETLLSTTVWLPCNSATLAKQYRIILDKYAKETSSIPEFVDWQGHDFSMRGMAGLEASIMSSAGHLLSFTGTDTIPTVDFLEEYYNANSETELIGGSVAATEHSVMCMGTNLGEQETFKRLITEVYPNGIVSIVSDTWDLWKVLTEYLPNLKQEVLARDGKVVVRPDSGDPVDIICGNPNGKTIEERKGVIELLWETFGGVTNEKGYKELDSHIGAIYGDSITLDRATQICERLKEKGFASTNVVLGIGSFTYQYNTRDTFGFAMKATYGEVAGEGREIYKDPITDDGTKKSAKGLMKIIKENGEYKLIDQVSWEEEKQGELREVYRDGQLLIDEKLSEIRLRVK